MHFNVIAFRVPGKYFIVCQHKLKVQSYRKGAIPPQLCLSFGFVSALGDPRTNALVTTVQVDKMGLGCMIHTWEMNAIVFRETTSRHVLQTAVYGGLKSLMFQLPFTQPESDFGGMKRKRGVGEETRTLPVREESKQKDGIECEQENFIT